MPSPGRPASAATRPAGEYGVLRDLGPGPSRRPATRRVGDPRDRRPAVGPARDRRRSALRGDLGRVARRCPEPAGHRHRTERPDSGRDRDHVPGFPHADRREDLADPPRPASSGSIRSRWTPTRAGGEFLYRVVGADGSVQNWAAGRYRIDVLVDGGHPSVRLHAAEPLRDRARPVGTHTGARRSRRPGRWRAAGPAGRAVHDRRRRVDPTGGRRRGPPLTEAAAWLNVDPGTGRPPRSYVAAVFASATTGLGVRLPDGSVIEHSAVRRLAPDPLLGEPELVRAVLELPVPPANVLYRPPGGGAWMPGVYELSVVWTDSAGRHERTWHVELRPGPVREVPSMLMAARGFARYAGSSGVVVEHRGAVDGRPARRRDSRPGDRAGERHRHTAARSRAVRRRPDRRARGRSSGWRGRPAHRHRGSPLASCTSSTDPPSSPC